MKQYIKSYSIFFPNKIFWILHNFLFPVFILSLVFLQRLFISNNILILLITALLIIGLESFIDFYIFGGIAKSDSCRNEYLKTSARYAIIMQRAFIADAVRRFIVILVVMLVLYVILKVPSDIIIFMLSSVYFFVSVSLCILRFAEDLFIRVLVNSAVYIMYTIFFSVVFKYNLIGVADIVLFLLSLLLVIFHIKFLNLRMREEYYDEES